MPSRQTHILGNGERHCQSSQNPKNGPSGVPGSPCRPVPWCLSSPLTLCSHRPPGIRPAHTGRLPRANHAAVPEQGLRWMGGGVCFPRPLKISGLPRVPPSSRACRRQSSTARTTHAHNAHHNGTIPPREQQQPLGVGLGALRARVRRHASKAGGYREAELGRHAAGIRFFFLADWLGLPRSTSNRREAHAWPICRGKRCSLSVCLFLSRNEWMGVNWSRLVSTSSTRTSVDTSNWAGPLSFSY